MCECVCIGVNVSVSVVCFGLPLRWCVIVVFPSIAVFPTPAIAFHSIVCVCARVCVYVLIVTLLGFGTAITLAF